MVFYGLILIGLLELLRRALLAHRVMNAVMAEHGRHASRRWAWWVRPLLFPFPWRPRSVKRTGPLFYGGHSRQRLDVYRSRDVQAPGPVLVYFHGGGYFTGSNRHEARTLLYHLASNGWTCISATYRLRPRFGFPEHLADARAALAWAHANAATHDGDTNRVVMAGSSAGGNLTALCALTQHEPGNPRVDAAVSLYAYYGRYYGRDEHESPVSTALALDASQAPPFFITHGDHDSSVPVEDARALRDHLVQGSHQEVWYAELPGGQHAFDVYASWRTMAVIDGIDAFLQETKPAC